jgi:hypothetical protein
MDKIASIRQLYIGTPDLYRGLCYLLCDLINDDLKTEAK